MAALSRQLLRSETDWVAIDDAPGRGGFSMYVPEDYTPDRAWPLIMALHGGGGTGRAFLWSWLRSARTRGAVLIAPTSVGATWALSGPDGDTPLGAYLTALDRALASDPRERGVDGFRGGPRGQAWADALDELGSWAYQRIIGPLLDHVRTWSLNHQPHLVLVTLGELGAIPYAAAWTSDGPAGAERGGRRYALDDMVLSYAASARLLAEVARRPARPLGERVVLVASPRGEHPMTRRATRLLATRQYPEAEVYGLPSERSGPATIGALR